jgi:uncharacterized protein (TIGR00369 family)
MNTAHFRKLERMGLRSNFNKMVFDEASLHVSEGKAEICLKVSEKFFHALNAIHGSVYFKLLDDACFLSASSLIEDVFIVTTSFNINFIRPVNAGTIKAIGKVRHLGKNNIVAEATLYNEAGKEVAFGTGNFVRSKAPLTKEIGYV